MKTILMLGMIFGHAMVNIGLKLGAEHSWYNDLVLVSILGMFTFFCIAVIKLR